MALMMNRFYYAFANETIQAPEQQDVELAARRGCKHSLELLAIISLSRGSVPVLSADPPPLSCGTDFVCTQICGNLARGHPGWLGRRKADPGQ